jgi:hypothetical protein
VGAREVIAALSVADDVTIVVVGVFVGLALITILRLVLRRDPPSQSRFRVGVFVERDQRDEPDRPDDAPR